VIAAVRHGYKEMNAGGSQKRVSAKPGSDQCDLLNRSGWLERVEAATLQPAAGPGPRRPRHGPAGFMHPRA
jgi:hypothetical protein